MTALKILVTGASGFVGRHVVQRLVSQGHHVLALARGVTDTTNLSHLENVDWIPCDLGDDQQVEELIHSGIGNVEAVVHLAWQGLPNYQELFHFERNLPVSYRFLKRMIENGTQRILVAGTCLEYGMSAGALSEDQAVEPNCSYALAKDCLRRFLELLQKSYCFKFSWVRLFYVYGPGQHPRSLISQLHSAVSRGDTEFPLSAGEQLRDFLPVQKAADYITSLLESDGNHGVVNVCDGKPTSVRRLVEQWLVAENKQIQLKLGAYPYPDYEPMAFWGDNRKLLQILAEQSSQT